MSQAKSTSLSVILCNYNHAPYLGDALAAIVTQSRPPDEVIVVDDGSTDDSRNVLARNCDRYSTIKPVFNEQNLGVVASANRGARRAIGDYLFFAAADDYVLPGFFENSMRLAEKYPGVGLVCSDPAFTNGEEGEETILALPLGPIACRLNPGEVVKAQQSTSFLIPGHTSLLNRSAAVNAGLLLSDLRWHCDWFLNLVIAFRHGVAYLPGGYSVMRRSENSYSSLGIRKWTCQRAVLRALVRHVHSAEYSDVKDAFVDSGVLSQFGKQILRLACTDPCARSLLTARVLLRIASAPMRIVRKRLSSR